MSATASRRPTTDGAPVRLGIVTLLDLPLVVVGGGLADRLGATFVGRIEQSARNRMFTATSPLRVVPAELGDQGGAVGAALVAAERAG